MLMFTAPVKAIEYPRTVIVEEDVVVDVVTVEDIVSETVSPPFIARAFVAVANEREYLPVPEENLNPIDYVIPDFIWSWQSRQILQWKPLIEENTSLDPILILALIAQESRGDASLDSYFNDIQDGVGLMQIVPRAWLGTKSQLLNPGYNIATGTSMLESIIEQALEKGYKPGREALRYALAAYNCGFKSLDAGKCYSFGGWRYADLILNYWYPLLLEASEG